MAIELEKMLLPVNGDSSAGMNEEYSPFFMEMDKLTLGVVPPPKKRKK